MRRFSARLRRCRFSCFTTNASSTVPSQHLRVHVDDRLNLLCSDRRPSAYAYRKESITLSIGARSCLDEFPNEAVAASTTMATRISFLICPLSLSQEFAFEGTA